MSEENWLRVQRENCCRLCLAPDTECISILNSCAADKEPLANKIFNCVSIKITSSDKLSLRICHACISYLNSWQSFKNRCISSQTKQRNWLDSDKRQQLLDNNISISTIQNTSSSSSNQGNSRDHQHDDNDSHNDVGLLAAAAPSSADQTDSKVASSILEGISSLKKRKSLTVYPLPAVTIKDEPLDMDEEENKHDESDEMMDPTLFLERTEEEGDEPFMQYTGGERLPLATSAVKEASCRACNLKFSTRANARRHERNLHPHLFELSTDNSNTPITKPTPALAAALELQRANTAALEAVKAMEATSIISPQKYRQEVLNAFNKYETGGIDYENPERYKHLLTDEKVIFIQQNEDFLKQYQNMTCRCCNKFYPTYKLFMAHMRKKYPTLPRNLCFGCLKMNDSKALFISHLKRRNCVNLYKIISGIMTNNAGFAAAVSAATAGVSERIRGRDLLINKIYECKLCSKEFNLKFEFRTHIVEEHPEAKRKDVKQSNQCIYCGLEFEDAIEKKRHLQSVECLALLRCDTCQAKFEHLPMLLEHVNDIHLVGFGDTSPLPMKSGAPSLTGESSMNKRFSTGAASDDSRSSLTGGNSANKSANFGNAAPRLQYSSRMPQACPICGQQYNNYNNVLRHMESKHPDQLPQTYKCVKCGQGFARLSILRDHMVSLHGGDKNRQSGFEYIVNSDAKSADGANSSGSNVYTGRYDYVMKDLMSITNGGNMADEDEEEEPVQNVSKKMRLDDAAAGAAPVVHTTKECPICNAVFANNIGLSNHMRSHAASNQSAAMAALRLAPNSVTITATTTGNGSTNSSAGSNQPTNTAHSLQNKSPTEQAMFKRSLEQAADRRFRRMRCRLCQRRFSSKKSYRFHMLNDHQIRNVQFIKCKLCDAEFAYEKGLKVHMFKIHNTLLKDEMIIKQFECEICSIVYRTEEQLRNHKKSIHGDENAQPDDGDTSAAADASANQSGLSTPVSGITSVSASAVSASLTSSNFDSNAGPLLWYQCKYCPSNFNTNKKLAIHINSHDEFDSNDYSCKDCGNVYSGRKSLWVHRYKKHPQIAEPSECTLCKKVFFDSGMLDNHIPTCNRKPITATGALDESGFAAAGGAFKHKTGDDDDEFSDDDGQQHHSTTLGGGKLEITPINTTTKIKIPEVACTMCGARFTDQELFTKHIQMHEAELYTDNPLAAMFDTGPADPNQFYLDRVNDNGEYACDLCAKTFTQMASLKVHRKWHFRGDSKQNPSEADPAMPPQHQQLSSFKTPNYPQHRAGSQAAAHMQQPTHYRHSSGSSSRPPKRKRQIKCDYCPSVFISNNNLRRHLYEIHKDVVNNLPEPPKIECEEYLRCRKCDVKFETKAEWIEHKVGEARVMKPFCPFQWGCDLCGTYVSRKEKLINHINNHMKESVIVPVEQQQARPNLPKAPSNQAVPNVATNSKQNAVNAIAQLKTEQNQHNNEEYEEDDAEADGENDGEKEAQAVAKFNYEDEEEAEEDEEVEEAEAEVDYEEEIDEDEESETGEPVNINENAQNGDDDEDAEDIEMLDEDEDMEENSNEDDDEDDAQTTIEVKTTTASKNHRKSNMRPSNDTTEAEDSPSYAGGSDDDEDDDLIEEDDGDTMSSSDHEPKPPAPKLRFACELCQDRFDTQQDLQKHVKMHFLNGPGSISLTGIKSKTSHKSSRSSSSEVAVSSS